jgi:anti-anti-sigma factor
VSEFQITRQREPEVLLLSTAGYINDEGGERIRSECEAALEENLKKIIIDFGASELINSVGIANLIAVIERVEERHGKLVFARLSPTVREVFEMIGITKHVQIFDDADTARDRLSPPTP